MAATHKLDEQIMASIVALGGSAKASRLAKHVIEAMATEGSSADMDEVKAEIWRLVDIKRLNWTASREIAAPELVAVEA